MKSNIDGCLLIDVDRARNSNGTRSGCNTVTLYKLLGICGLTVEWIRFDRTKHGWHIVISTKERLNYGEILILQSLLGDDQKRSAYNFRRLRNGIWLNQLFEPTKGITDGRRKFRPQ